MLAEKEMAGLTLHFTQPSCEAPILVEAAASFREDGYAVLRQFASEAEGRGVGRRRRPTAATDGGGDGGDGRRCDPVSSPNVKGRGASPATPWFVPTAMCES